MKNQKFLPWLTLLFFLAAGLFIYDDYGIAWDENFQRHDNGLAVWNYVSNNDFKSYNNNPEKYHGPAFELVLVGAEKLTGFTDSREIYLQRHLLSFLLFWFSGIALYLLIAKRYTNNLVIIIGICWYFLMPRIFADSFFNTKDIPFLAMNMICLYSLYRLLEEQRIKWAIVHGVFCGFMIAIRIMGILIPAITIFALLFYLIYYKSDYKKVLFTAIVFGTVTLLTTIICWPVLWQQPFIHLFAAWQEMSKYPWASSVLYRGNFVNTLDLPWHYAITWIGITTPLLYLTFLFIGMFFLLKKLKMVFKEKKVLYDFLLLGLMSAPLASVVLLNSVMYDGWRHLFFIYAPMCLLMISGLNHLHEFLKRKGKSNRLLIPIVVITMYYGWWMVKWHPYQNVYFNMLADKNQHSVMNKYELDYWGTGYRAALEKVANKDSSPKIKVHVSNAPGVMNSWILKEQMRNRFEFVTTNDSADYFITNYRWEIRDTIKLPLIDSIVVDGAVISGTYSIKTN